MIIGVPRESFPGERRVALIPAALPALAKAGLECRLETGAGAAAGYPDSAYTDKGARMVSRRELFEAADLLLMVRAAGANPDEGKADLALMRPGQTLIALLEPLWKLDDIERLAATGVTAFALELIPRVTRAQAMDVLSSMATISGYKAVLLAADHLPRMFPLLMTAAGTVTPARVFVVGAGVAGLQAISVARRLGATVQAYDVRPAVKQEVESVGARFLELPLDTTRAGKAGEYARAMDDEFYRHQREMMLRVVADSDVVITTAAIPGKKSPVLLTREMVGQMTPGSVIVDVAAERGGNCELTRPGQTVVENGVTILGPVNLPSEVPYHASQMFSKNVTTFLLHLIRDGQLAVDPDDPIARETLVARDGQIVHDKVRDAREGRNS